MFSCIFIYSLPQNGHLITHINDGHDQISRYKFHYQKDKPTRIGEKIFLRRHA